MQDQYFYGYGKILLTGEYFILDGARGIALPTSLGQSLFVRYAPSFHPKFSWKSFDEKGNVWFETEFEFWHFDIIGGKKPSEGEFLLQKILRQVRKQNIHFLRDDMDVFVETHLGFPLNWGLGSSSTLISLIARWARISPFKLFFNIFGGSGYDVACAESPMPILYQKNARYPSWQPLLFSPPFKDNLYFVHLGRKKNSRESIEYYRSKGPFESSTMEVISNITNSIVKTQSLEEFQECINSHEDIVAKNLGLPKVKDMYFHDFSGTVKSLGAWGGDFVLAVSTLGDKKTKKYFKKKGFPVCFPYNQFIASEAPSAYIGHSHHNEEGRSHFIQ